MEFPQEIEVWYTIPAVRRELARRLVAAGLTQREVAKKLGVTEAAVSQYLSNKRGTAIEYQPVIQKALALATKTIQEASDESIVRREIQNLCNIMKEHKVICDIHKKHGSVKEGCKTCFD